MDASLLVQYLLNGLMLGMMYALVAVGFTLFFGVMDMIIFSHGDVVTMGAFTGLATYLGLILLGVDWAPAQVAGIVSEAFIEGVGDLAEGVIAFREGAPVEKLPGGEFFTAQYTAQDYSHPHEAYGPFAFTAMSLLLDT
ncbi:MAG: ABC transporter permease subunit, partial [Gammaproteobacteria bacterium]